MGCDHGFVNSEHLNGVGGLVEVDPQVWQDQGCGQSAPCLQGKKGAGVPCQLCVPLQRCVPPQLCVPPTLCPLGERSGERTLHRFAACICQLGKLRTRDGELGHGEGRRGEQAGEKNAALKECPHVFARSVRGGIVLNRCHV